MVVKRKAKKRTLTIPEVVTEIVNPRFGSIDVGLSQLGANQLGMHQSCVRLERVVLALSADVARLDAHLRELQGAVALALRPPGAVSLA